MNEETGTNHQIDKVQIAGNCRHIVASTHVVRSDRNGGGQQQSGFSNFLCFGVECFFQFLQQKDKVLFVVAARRVFPILKHSEKSQLKEIDLSAFFTISKPSKLRCRKNGMAE